MRGIVGDREGWLGCYEFLLVVGGGRVGVVDCVGYEVYELDFAEVEVDALVEVGELE